MAEIKIEMCGADFAHLWHTASRWKGGSWSNNAGRFESTVDGADVDPSWDWKVAYWLGENWGSVILARAFLASVGHECEVLWDMSEEHGFSFVILTDYVAERDRLWFEVVSVA